jgi:alpha-glucosidase
MLLLLTLRGTPFLYAGEELGLEDATVPLGQVVDPGGRDGCRSPLPWTTDEYHGWGRNPWLPFAAHSVEMSVEAQQRDADSILHFTRQLLQLRRSECALSRGQLENVQLEGDLLTFDRVDLDDRFRIMVNFGKNVAAINIPESTMVLSTDATDSQNELQANQALIIKMDAQ